MFALPIMFGSGNAFTPETYADSKLFTVDDRYTDGWTAIPGYFGGASITGGYWQSEGGMLNGDGIVSPQFHSAASAGEYSPKGCRVKFDFTDAVDQQLYLRMTIHGTSTYPVIVSVTQSSGTTSVNIFGNGVLDSYSSPTKGWIDIASMTATSCIARVLNESMTAVLHTKTCTISSRSDYEMAVFMGGGSVPTQIVRVAQIDYSLLV